MRRVSKFGSSYAGLGAFQRAPRGLGVIGADQQTSLVDNVEVLWNALDVLGARFNDAAAAGVPQETLDALRAERTRLRSSLQRLQDRVSVLQTESDVAVWQEAYREIAAHTAELAHQTDRAMRATSTGRLWQVGLWTGGITLGVVGAIVLVRWFGSKRRRR